MSETAGRWSKLYGSAWSGRALSLSRDARFVAIEAEAWCDDAELDGFVPANSLRRFTDAPDPLEPIVAELVAAGRWTEVQGGWQIVGFLDRHDTADARGVAREINAAKSKGYREHVAGRHNPNGPRSCRACDATRIGGTTGDTNARRTGGRTGSRSDSDSEATASLDRLAHSASSASAPAAPLARPRRPMSEEAKAKMRATREANVGRLRHEADERQRAEHERLAAQQARRDEWLSLGGPASHRSPSDEDVDKLRRGWKLITRPSSFDYWEDPHDKAGNLIRSTRRPLR